MLTSEITVRPQVFAAAVAWAAKWVDSRPVTPIAGGLALGLQANSNGTDELVITAHNETVTARAVVDVGVGGGAGAEPQRAVVSARLLGELAATFGGKHDVVIGGTEKTVTLRVGTWTGTLPAMPEDDWPPLPTPPTIVGVVSGDALAAAAKRVRVAVGSDTHKDVQMLTLMNLTLSAGSIELMASDRYRVAVDRVSWWASSDGDDITLTPNGEMFADACAAFAGPGEVQIRTDGNSVALQSPTRSVIMRLSDPGPNGWPRAVFVGKLGQIAALNGSASVQRTDLVMPLKRAAIVRGKAGPVQLGFGDTGTLTIASAEAELEQDGNEAVAVECESNAAIAVNPDYFADGLTSAPGDTVELTFEDSGETFSSMPILMTSPDHPDWRYLTMPVRK